MDGQAEGGGLTPRTADKKMGDLKAIQGNKTILEQELEDIRNQLNAIQVG